MRHRVADTDRTVGTVRRSARGAWPAPAMPSASGRLTTPRLAWVVALLAALLAGPLAGCGTATGAESGRAASGHTADRYVEGGDATRGKAAIQAYGCGSCHAIPGVPQAHGMVGPSLEHWAQREMIAGEVPNDPERLITWITVPQSIEPGTAMPNMGVTDGEARDIAAYLYTLH